MRARLTVKSCFRELQTKLSFWHFLCFQRGFSRRHFSSPYVQGTKEFKKIGNAKEKKEAARNTSHKLTTSFSNLCFLFLRFYLSSVLS